MKQLNALLRIEFRGMLSAHLVFLGVNIGIVLIILFAISYSTLGTNGTYQNFCVTAGVYMFVMSVTSIRSTMRLGAQMGTSRRTMFLTFTLYALSSALLMAVVGEIFLTAANFITVRTGSVIVTDLYPTFFLNETNFIDFTLAQHLQTILFNASTAFLCTAFGAALSLLLWRLNKLGQVLAVALVCTLPMWLPLLLIRIAAYEIDLLTLYRLLEQPLFLDLSFLAISVVCLLLSGFWGRKVHIRPAK